MLFKQEGNYSPILHGRALLQEFLNDMYVCVERSQTNYLCHNQAALKVKNHRGLCESLENKEDPQGKKVILPSTFIGSPRAMSQLYQDAMAIYCVNGALSLLITMMANPAWPEITAAIPDGANPMDHPTEIVRVTYLKLKRLLFELVQMRQLGLVIAYVSTIEFQKRGLPHAHILAILHPEDQPRTIDDLNDIISAEIPDQRKEPNLLRAVSKHMVHGPCGVHNPQAPCMENGKCSKRYPKALCEETVMD